MSDRQLFDALPAHIESALRDSIEEFGVLVPVFVDQDGEVIDGHHRSRIATSLGVEFDTVTVEVADEEHALRIAHTLNADRRQLSATQRIEAAARLREKGHSYRAIGEALGTSHTQAKRDAAGVTDVPPESPPEVRGRDGKSYPASRPEPAEHADEGPPPPPSPDVGEWVDGSTSVQDAKYLHEFAKAMARSDDFLSYDPERIGAIGSDHEVSSLAELLQSTTEFVNRVKRARSGLRVMNGGKS